MIRKGRAAKAVFLGNTPLDSRSRESIDLRSEYFRSAQLTFETWLPTKYSSCKTARQHGSIYFRLSSLGQFSRSAAMLCSRAAAALSRKEAW